ncbi:MAG: rRNA biogenesis protein rrp5 [Chaenotheca gracillima]|nr:MAG: rRNA biogenesis protein rrp5 [Chaenotheca gracillima]
MPYTPPAQLSPSVSKFHSPTRSRSQSAADPSTSHDGLPTSPTLTRPDLPRSSSSYLHKHRRSPSILKNVESLSASSRPEMAEEDARGSARISESLRQSPPPRSDAIMPIGAVVSPPESSHASSDDDESPQKRGRELENLEELQLAIRNIELHRAASPDRAKEEMRQAHVDHGFASPTEGTAQEMAAAAPKALSNEARRISHSRSSTETAIQVTHSNESPVTESESDEDALPRRPHMVRKKSGELVKPALRPSSVRRRPSSMPGTPTYNKAVHFDANLEHIRHFLQVDRPLAVSAGSSPVEQYESDGEFPFGGSDGLARAREPPFEWELVPSNFSRPSLDQTTSPVKVERVFLSGDNKNLVGAVAVANLAFNKLVVARFTFDYWKTTSEVVAEYSDDVRRKQSHDGYDRFNFNIKLEDQANLETKTMFFCMRYNVNGQEYWDNNRSRNFQVEFKKKPKPQHGKQGVVPASSRPLNSLPRSRPSPPLSSARPKSMPASFDDFVDSIDSKYDFGPLRKQPSAILGEDDSPVPIRLKGAKVSEGPLPDSPARRTTPAGQAFGNRYDFGASLSAAISAANSSFGDRSGVKARDPSKPQSKYFSAQPNQSAQVASSASKTSTENPAKATLLGPNSEKPPLQSSSYHELLDRYCFYGSAKSSPTTGTSSAAAVCQTGSSVGQDRPASSSSPPQDSTSSSVSPADSDVPQRRSRSTSPSPVTGHSPGSGMESPVSFGYPYHHGNNNAFPFSGTHTPTAIHG